MKVTMAALFGLALGAASAADANVVCIRSGPHGGVLHVRPACGGNETRLGSFEALQLLLSAVSSEEGGSTLRFTGVNVQVVSGSGATDGPVNGRGNLIVGYNNPVGAIHRTGSHNLVVGDSHSYGSYGGLVAGFANIVDVPFSTVSGGECNAAGAFTSEASYCPLINGVASVSGGFRNAAGLAASVSGGALNIAVGFAASVTGGRANDAGDDYSTVSGGACNLTGPPPSLVTCPPPPGGENIASSVCGGYANAAQGNGASVSGGEDNNAFGAFASVSGGQNNSAHGAVASVSGGLFNFADADYTSISGGEDHHALVPYEWHAGQSAGYPTGTEY